MPLRSNFEPGTSRWATRRAQWRALGLTDEDMVKPKIAIAVMHKLQHLDINTLGIVWARTPANYENISQVLAAMEIIGPDGGVTLYDATKTK